MCHVSIVKMFRALMLMLATTILADVAADNEFDGVFDEAAQRQQQDPSKEALRRLFDKYGGRDSGQITFEGFEHLFESLGLGHIVMLDHDVHDHHADDGQFRSLHDNHVHTDVPQQSDYSEQHADIDRHHSHDHQQRYKRSAGAAALQQSALDGTDISQCLTPVKVLHMFHVDGRSYGISQLDFVRMCPTIIYQLDAHLCHPHLHAPCHSESVNRRQHCRRYHGLLATDGHQQRSRSSSLTDPAVWGSATVAVTVISLVGLVAVAIIPVMAHRTFYNHLLHFLVAVAIATLTGDALLHLLPHALMPHGQHPSPYDVNVTSYNMTSSGERHADADGDDDAEKETDHDEASVDMVWKGLVVLSGIYVFFITERLISLCRTVRRRSNKKAVSGLGAVEPRLSSHGDKCQSAIGELSNDIDVHAAGAAFANGFAGGIGTTTAVFCHELPHELGDFAVLLRSGMTVRQAITYNMVSSVLAFTGMCIGIVLGTVHWTASSWVFALTAGIFIYVSLVDMLPEITRDSNESLRSKYLSLVLDIVGMSLGVLLMMTIAFYEDNIQLLLDK